MLKILKYLGIFYLVCLMIQLITTYPVVFIIAGLLLVVLVILQKKGYIPSPPSKQELTNTDSSDAAIEENSRSLVCEEFRAAGVHYYEKEIGKLAVKNEPWKYNAKTIIANGDAGRKIYRYNYINKPVKLIPEPDNPHDKNAIMIQIAGEKVGYIKAEEARHVNSILKNREIKYISAFIGGGPYKVVDEDGSIFQYEMGLSVTVKIAYVKES